MDNNLKELNDAIGAAFEGCRLVFGEGTADARIMLIGEAPGEREEQLLRPFVGKAGKNLDEFLELSGISREKLYITNAVKYRPYSLSKSSRKVNRTPSDKEVCSFRPFLLREIELVAPKVVVTLGNTALLAVTGEKRSIGLCHGKLMEVGPFMLYPMYHPASVIYNRSLKEVYSQDAVKLGKMALSYD